MHEVAGGWATWWTDVFAWYSGFIRARLSQLMPLAREFGLALQTVTSSAGCAGLRARLDLRTGELLRRGQLRRSDLFKPEYQIQALQVVDMVADKAEGTCRRRWPTCWPCRRGCTPFGWRASGRCCLPPAPWPSAARTSTCWWAK